MSWVVEQSENSSAVNVNDDTITCTKEEYYGSPINIMYKDPADQNGQYFWQIEFTELSAQSSGSVSVGLTTDKGFQSGWGLKGMNYLGNLSDGSGLLVQNFGDRIKQNDKIGILLQLSDADLKMYIFHNDRPLGLAFHIQSPYPKPLYPVISFSSNGKVKISRSEQIPSLLDRQPLQFTGFEGHWKIIDDKHHPECIGCPFEITRDDQDEHTYHLHIHEVNSINCTLRYNPTSKQWKTSSAASTLMGGPPEVMRKEHLIQELISNIQNLTVQDDQQLIIEINDGEQVRLQRFIKASPPTVTKNIFG